MEQLSQQVPVWALGLTFVMSAVLPMLLRWAWRALQLWMRERRTDRGEERRAEESTTATIAELLRESRFEIRELGNRLEHATEVAISLREENAKLRADAVRFSAELASVRGQVTRLEAALAAKDVVIAELRTASANELVEAVRREMGG